MNFLPKILSRFALAAGLALAAAPLTGCIVTQSGPGYYGSGSMVVDWTISNSTTPSLCTATGSAYLEVTIDAPASVGGGVFQQACATFATSVDLDPGTYNARARLVDGSGNARTTSVELGPIRIQDGYSTPVSIDFPPNAFY